MEKQKLLSLTKKDFRIDYYRGTGNGGQKKNKTSSACRITHIETGIAACSEESRSQHDNKKIAFQKLCNNPAFMNWVKIQSAIAAGTMKSPEQLQKEVDEMIERDLKNGNIKIEEYEVKR